MQKNFFKYSLSLVLALLTTVQGSAQCAMCRAALENSDQGIQPESVNDGIVYLMIFPYLLVGIVGFIVYRMRQKALQKKEAQP